MNFIRTWCDPEPQSPSRFMKLLSPLACSADAVWVPPTCCPSTETVNCASPFHASSETLSVIESDPDVGGGVGVGVVGVGVGVGGGGGDEDEVCASKSCAHAAASWGRLSPGSENSMLRLSQISTKSTFRPLLSAVVSCCDSHCGKVGSSCTS